MSSATDNGWIHDNFVTVPWTLFTSSTTRDGISLSRSMLQENMPYAWHQPHLQDMLNYLKIARNIARQLLLKLGTLSCKLIVEVFLVPIQTKCAFTTDTLSPACIPWQGQHCLSLPPSSACFVFSVLQDCNDA